MPPPSPPAVTLTSAPAGPAFPMGEDTTMPTIDVTATLQNVQLAPNTPVTYAWRATLEFNGVSCAHSVNRQTSHPAMAGSATTPNAMTNTWRVPFTAVRGGDLTVSVTVTSGSLLLTATSQGLKVTGTNPSVGSLMQTAPNIAAFRKLLRLESGLRQFAGPSCPLFSGDNLGGVGIAQVTSPAPTDEQVWSWKANLAAGVALWRSKESIARGYPRHVRTSPQFQELVRNYNAKRVAKSTPQAPLQALTIDLPDYTDEQLQRDTLRGFNGYALGLHEYRVHVDSDGVLVVNVDAGGTKGTAEWEQVTVADRIAAYDAAHLTRRGDPNYVDDVLARAGF